MIDLSINSQDSHTKPELCAKESQKYEKTRFYSMLYEDGVSKSDLSFSIGNITNAKFYSVFDEDIDNESDQSFNIINLQNIYEIEDKFFCVICENLLNKVCQLECGCKACYNCLKTYLDKGNKNCPTDNCTEYSISRLLRDKAFEREMKVLVYKCINKDCTEKIDLTEFYEHRQICQYSFVKCRNCFSKVQIQNKSEHNLKKCLSKDLSNSTLNYEAGIFSENIKRMLSIFEEEIRQCKLKQDDILESIKEQESKSLQYENRIETVRSSVDDLEDKITKTYIKNSLTMGNYGEYFWKISDFEFKKERSSKIIAPYLLSPPFYTSIPGYKVCLKLYPNGDGKGKDSHLSLYMLLLKGKYDNLLKWPFSKKFTLSLLNKDGKKNSFTMKPDPKMSAFQRNYSTNNGIGSGESCFLKVEQLSENYFCEDTIFVKFKIES